MSLDQYGIRKIYPNGRFGMNAQLIKGRQDGSSNRWNVASDEPPGAIPSPQTNIHYEITGYIKINASSSGFNAKIWGPHHGSKGTPFEGSKTPCCWYDIGIDGTGKVKPQIEFPHPENFDKPLPAGGVPSIGSIQGKWVGVKWIVFKIGTTRHIEFWWDKGGLTAAGKPANLWTPLFKKVDNGDWLKANYSPPNQQEIELRVKDVDPAAIEIKYLYARDITPPTTAAVARFGTILEDGFSPVNWT